MLFTGPQNHRLLVFGLIGFVYPTLKNGPAFVTHKARDRDLSPLKISSAKFVVNKCVVESRFGGVVTAAGNENTFGPCPVDRPKAHRARLAGCVNDAAIKLKRIQVCACVADSHDLRMRGRIVS